MYQERIKNLREQARKLYGISFECRSYTTINPNEYVGCLFYLDPPTIIQKLILNKILIIISSIIGAEH